MNEPRNFNKYLLVQKFHFLREDWTQGNVLPNFEIFRTFPKLKNSKHKVTLQLLEELVFKVFYIRYHVLFSKINCQLSKYYDQIWQRNCLWKVRIKKFPKYFPFYELCNSVIFNVCISNIWKIFPNFFSYNLKIYKFHSINSVIQLYLLFVQVKYGESSLFFPLQFKDLQISFPESIRFL